jgi:hypothetical protein
VDSLDSMWTGGGLEVDFMDYIETRGRLQEDPWGSVRYRRFSWMEDLSIKQFLNFQLVEIGESRPLTSHLNLQKV